jgi:hypothetical protein
MKQNRILTESERKEILNDKERLIIASFRKEFNKIKRINESNLSETPWNSNPENNWVPFNDKQEVELYGLKDVTITLPFNGEYSINGETSGNGSFSLYVEDLASIFPEGYKAIKAFGIEIIEALNSQAMNSHEMNQPQMLTINASKLRGLPHYNDIEGYMSYYFDNGLNYNDIVYDRD